MRRILQSENLEERRLLAADFPFSGTGTAEISGTKWLDANGDGVRDTGEGPLEGVVIYLDLNNNGVLDAGSIDPEPQTLTNAAGEYSFAGLDAGDFVVREVVPGSFLQTYPAASPERLFAVPGGISGASNEIVEVDPNTGAEINRFAAPTATSGGPDGLAYDGSHLWFINGFGDDTLYQLDPDSGAVIDADLITAGTGAYDGLAALNGNIYILDFGLDDIFEFDPASDTITNQLDLAGIGGGLAGITGPDRLVSRQGLSIVEIDPASGAVTNSFANDGGFGFGVIGGQIYTNAGGANPIINVYSRAGVLENTITLPFQSSALGADDVDVSIGDAHSITLVDGAVISGLDFGNQPLFGQIHGTKFNDLDGDGARDAGEPPLQGVTIYLDTNDNGVLDIGEPETLTNADGEYWFMDLPADDYVVREVVPGGFEQTSPLAPDRLFATNVASVPDQIVEIDPVTGDVLNQFPTPGLNTAGHGLAFDGTTLYYVNFVDDVLNEMDPDTGSVLDSTGLPFGAYDGLAAIDGLVYIMNFGNNDILVFDPVSNTIVGTLDVDGTNPGISLQGGLGESNGQLVATTTTNDVVFIDTTTAVTTTMFNHGVSGNDVAVSGIGDEIFLGFSSGLIDIQVYDQNGVFQRTVDVDFPVFALGGAAGNLEGAYRVALEPSQIITGLDFGNRAVFAEIHGTKFEDINGNGVRDGAEGPLEGVTIYLDLNDNGVFDAASEPSTLTAADGGYWFQDLLAGDYVVREVVPSGFVQTAPNIARLFVTDLSATPDQIVELDPVSGSQLNQFPAPTNFNTGGHGLALDGNTLYFADFVSDTIYELDANTGSLLDSTALPTGSYDGVAALDGLVYLAEFSLEDILIFDPVSNSITGTLDINGLNPGINLSGGLGEISGPSELIATTSTDEVVFIDPITGAITSSFNHNLGFTFDAAVAGSGQAIYLGFTTGTVQVYERNGTLNRSFDPGVGGVFGLGASDPDDAHRVTLQPGQVLEGLDFGNQRVNVQPTADAGGPYSVPEGGTVELNAAASSDPNQTTSTLTFLWDLDSDGTFGETGVGAERGDEVGISPTFSAAGLDGPSSVTVDLQVIDNGGLIDEDTATVGITNVAPVIEDLTLSAATIDENGSVQLTVTFADPGTPDTHDAVINWGDGSLDTIVKLTGGERSFTVTHQYLDDNPTNTPTDQYRIDVRIDDDNDGSDQTGAGESVSSSVIDFAALAHDGSSQVLVNSVSEDGFTVAITSSPLANLEVFGSAHPSFAGSTSLSTFSQIQTVAVTRDGGGEFTLQSLDLSEYQSGPVFSPAQVTFTGYRADSSTVTQTVTSDGVFGFQTVNFAGFTDLLSVIWMTSELGAPDSFHQFDNIVLKTGAAQIPSPVITVDNLDPTIDSIASTAAFANKALPGDVITVSGTFSDVGSLDTHTAVVNWDDGTTSTATIDQLAGTFTADHAYTTGGIFQVTVTLTDDDTGTAIESTTAVVTGVRLTSDGELQVVGTDGKDIVVVKRVGGDSDGGPDDAQIQVVANLNIPDGSDGGADIFLFDPDDVSSIHIVLCKGDDHANVGNTGSDGGLDVAIPALIDGGDGDDHLTGGSGDDMIFGGDGRDFLHGRSGNDVLVGGDGDDQLQGDGGLDLLIGGFGEDDLKGGWEDDILIGGLTTFDNDLAALAAIRAEWTSAATYEARVANLTSGSGPNLVAGSTVLDDVAQDTLNGQQASDWFFAALGQDKVKDESGEDVVAV